MRKAFDRLLEKNIDKLPKYNPEDNLWEKIEEELVVELEIISLKENLSEHQPNDDLWNKIEDQIESKEEQLNSVVDLNKSKIYLYSKIAVAASLAFIIFRSILIETEDNNQIQIETELAYANEKTIEKTDEELIEQLEVLCTKHKEVCSSQTFEEKYKLVHQLNSELKELKEAISFLGESPEIIQSMKKIQILKSETINELLVMLSS